MPHLPEKLNIMSRTIDVPVRYEKKYTVRIGSGLSAQLQQFIEERYPSRLGLLVVDENVNRYHGQRIRGQFEQWFEEVALFEVPEGETSKSVDMWNKIIDFALNKKVERSTPLIALGGGVTGDLAGFAASATLRGLPLVHIPTTLLAMVDSSIGGKTGVNHTAGKNLVGAFYQPDAVFSDIEYLETLDRQEWINGLSEILKYAAIHSPSIFERAGRLLEKQGFSPSGEWADLIALSARIKADIVSEDTLEAGKRAFLNFGHTFGHALEKTAGYGAVSHGQAVFAGMIAAAYASRSLGAEVPDTRFDPFKALYPLKLNELIPDKKSLVNAMRTDKKVSDGRIRLILLKEWGSPYIYTCEDENLIDDSWIYALEQFS